MGKRFFTSAAAFSLIIWFAASALWIRSYWRTDFVHMWLGYVQETNSWTPGAILVAEKHKVWFIWPTPEYRKPPMTKRQLGFSSEPARPFMRGYDSSGFLGFRHEVVFYGESPCSNMFGIDYATLITIASILPALAFLGWWKGRRYRGEGICRACGYDLRASPDRCPECGTEPMKA